jgi:hypothetical protein
MKYFVHRGMKIDDDVATLRLWRSEFLYGQKTINPQPKHAYFMIKIKNLNTFFASIVIWVNKAIEEE